MVEFLLAFISQFKTCGYDIGGFTALKAKTDNPRSLLFLEIADSDKPTYTARNLLEAFQKKKVGGYQ